MKKILTFIIIWTLCLIHLSAEINWDGRFYEHAFILFRQDPERLFSQYFGFSVLDLKLDTHASDIVRVRSELEYALPHPEQQIIGDSSEMNRLNLNSLNATITPHDFKLILGRFLPQWGVSKIFRPLDIFIPQTFFLNSISYKGIDGFSGKYYVSHLSSFELMVIPSMDIKHLISKLDISTNNSEQKNYNDSVIAANSEIHIATFDNYIITLYNPKTSNKLLGYAFKGDILIGLWGELFYSFKGKQNMIKATLGMDYSFAKYYFISAEYFYDGSGVSDYKDYTLLAKAVSRMTLGKQYLMLDFNVITYIEQNFGITGIINLGDQSFIIFPYYRYEILNNTLLGVSVYHFNGKSEREFSPPYFGNYILNTYLVINF